MSKKQSEASVNELNHKALLSLLKVAAQISTLAEPFFGRYKTTDSEFNILMTLHKPGGEAGLSQKELSEQLILKKSNLVSLIDKLEERKLVERRKTSEDRRLNKICLTTKGREFLASIWQEYFAEVDRIMDNLSNTEKEKLVGSINKLDEYLQRQISKS